MKDLQYAEVFVAYADILKFKSITYGNEHDTLISLYKAFINTRELAYQIAPRNMLFRNKSTINRHIQSDGIALWSEDASFNSFTTMIETVSMLFQCAYSIGLPLRAALTSGPLSVVEEPMEIGHSVYPIGKSLVDAIIVESLQEWSGCVIFPRCIDTLKNSWSTYPLSQKLTIEEWLKVKEFHRLIKYRVPVKENAHECQVVQLEFGNSIDLEQYVINWFDPEVVHPLGIRQNFERHCIGKIGEKAETKLRNTLNFYQHVQEIDPILS